MIHKLNNYLMTHTKNVLASFLLCHTVRCLYLEYFIILLNNNPITVQKYFGRGLLFSFLPHWARNFPKAILESYHRIWEGLSCSEKAKNIDTRYIIVTIYHEVEKLTLKDHFGLCAEIFAPSMLLIVCNIARKEFSSHLKTFISRSCELYPPSPQQE